MILCNQRCLARLGYLYIQHCLVCLGYLYIQHCPAIPDCQHLLGRQSRLDYLYNQHRLVIRCSQQRLDYRCNQHRLCLHITPSQNPTLERHQQTILHNFQKVKYKMNHYALLHHLGHMLLHPTMHLLV